MLLKMHGVRFYKPEPTAIYCMALNKELRKLAVSRSDASIEIWNLDKSPFIERAFASSADNYSIEGLAWCGERLFSVGLHALLIEYDLKKLNVKNRTSVTGQTAFCIDIDKSNSFIAVGTESGYINIFTITEDGVQFLKFLDKQEGRILCLKYDASGKYIASGSMDAIRIWNVETGHAQHKMTTGRSEANKSTIVWCLYVTADFTVISGDSRGKITFWDGALGAQVESYQTHRADVLSICVSDDENTMYCAGIDSNIISYEKINVKGESHKWVKSIQRRVHDHDVRALTLHGNKLYSGGVDGYLTCSFHPPKTLLKYAPLLQNPCVIATEARYILLRYPRRLELWNLGASRDEETVEHSKYLPLKEDSKKLLLLQRTVKNDRGDIEEGIITSSISSNGKWIVYSTSTVLRLFNFNYKAGSKPELISVDNLPEECGISLNALFMPNNEQLILACQGGNLQVVSLKDEICLEQTLETDSYEKKEDEIERLSNDTAHIHIIDFNDVISFLTCSSRSQFLVAADAQSNIAVWKYIENSWKFYCKLPKYKHPVTAINIDPNSLNMVVVYSDHKLVEFNLIERRMTNFSKELGSTNTKFLSSNFPVTSVTFDPRRNGNVIILNDDSDLVAVKKESTLSDGAPKMRKIESDNENSAIPHYTVHGLKKYKHLVHLGWLSNDEAVAVEVSPLTLLEQLPPGFKENTFGTK